MPCGCVLLAYLGLSQVLDGSPRTVSFHIDSWENNSWGLHNIDRISGWGTVAISSDGSRSNNVHSNHYKHFLIRSGEYALRSVYNRPEHIAYRIDDHGKTATAVRCSCTWEAVTLPPFDADCGRAAEANLGPNVRSGTGRVAGVGVVRYRATDGGEHEVALAPQFGCDLLEEIKATYNYFGLPTSHFHFVIDSYVAGEPPKEHFSPPGGYRIRDVY